MPWRSEGRSGTREFEWREITLYLLRPLPIHITAHAHPHYCPCPPTSDYLLAVYPALSFEIKSIHNYKNVKAWNGSKIVNILVNLLVVIPFKRFRTTLGRLCHNRSMGNYYPIAFTLLRILFHFLFISLLKVEKQSINEIDEKKTVLAYIHKPDKAGTFGQRPMT